MYKEREREREGEREIDYSKGFNQIKSKSIKY